MFFEVKKMFFEVKKNFSEIDKGFLEIDEMFLEIVYGLAVVLFRQYLQTSPIPLPIF